MKSWLVVNRRGIFTSSRTYFRPRSRSNFARHRWIRDATTIHEDSERNIEIRWSRDPRNYRDSRNNRNGNPTISFPGNRFQNSFDGPSFSKRTQKLVEQRLRVPSNGASRDILDSNVSHFERVASLVTPNRPSRVQVQGSSRGFLERSIDPCYSFDKDIHHELSEDKIYRSYEHDQSSPRTLVSRRI